MSANRLFLVCSHHPQLEDAYCLAERATGESRYTVNEGRKEGERQNAWLAQHAGCGVDCIALAYHRPKGWDQSPAATNTPAGAVRVVLASGETGEPH